MKGVQAKDIDDVEALLAIEAERVVSGERMGLTRPAEWACIQPIAAWAFPDFPHKVVQAKYRALIKRGLSGGCGCGCRGDLHLTQAGRDFIEAHFSLVR